ncbi:SCO2322 family protein [Streptomyces sp. NPDC047014]|uniref:SCO2322 family protein n=1 Tax=Streptomyces sp. NPDC047014 TaxID=3155736 RepID=UPI0033FBED57
MRGRLPAAALALALGAVLTVLAAAPALAAGYRYWSFWDGAGGRWTYATQGPSTARPADGAVLGFRFAVSEDAAAEAAVPRAAADFQAVCGGTEAAEGRKRVALVIDFGVPEHAPPGDTPPQPTPRTACAQLAPSATAAEALAAVAKPLRYNSAALLCAIASYPKQGCGEQLAAAPSPAPSAPTATDGGPSLGLLAGLATLATLATAALLRSRRRTR